MTLNDVRLQPTRMSAPVATTAPPPHAKPLTAAITGIRHDAMCHMYGSRSTYPTSMRSAS